jgi:hypothetical protein
VVPVAGVQAALGPACPERDRGELGACGERSGYARRRLPRTEGVGVVMGEGGDKGRGRTGAGALVFASDGSRGHNEMQWKTSDPLAMPRGIG